jgi:hypothetical protein
MTKKNQYFLYCPQTKRYFKKMRYEGFTGVFLESIDLIDLTIEPEIAPIIEPEIPPIESENIDDEYEFKCCVCYDMKIVNSQSCCLSILCEKCYLKICSVSKKCPMCRKSYLEIDYEYRYGEEDNEKDEDFVLV